MRIHVFSVCWNEAKMAGFFLRHYGAFAERIVVYDEDSTDGSPSLLRSAPNVTLKRFVRTQPDSFDLSKKALYDACWKESRGTADWVMIVDMDEHVHHPRLVAQLAEYKRAGVTFVPALGFQMFTDEFPGKGERLSETRTRGAPDRWYSKPIVFDPDAVDELNLAIGGHSAQPTGRIVLPAEDELMLLHYKFLSLEYVAARNGILQGRRGLKDVENKWGKHYANTPEQIGREFQKKEAALVDIAAPGFRPGATHDVPRWRRPDSAAAGRF